VERQGGRGKKSQKYRHSAFFNEEQSRLKSGSGHKVQLMLHSYRDSLLVRKKERKRKKHNYQA
jgi:hypothetical protein